MIKVEEKIWASNKIYKKLENFIKKWLMNKKIGKIETSSKVNHNQWIKV
jgi:hypothetical protein